MAQLLAFPLGRLWARFLPNVKIFGISLNPGPFNVKEHVLITMMATVGYQSAYAVSIMARTIYFREANLALDRYYCGPASILQSNLQLQLYEVLHPGRVATQAPVDQWFLVMSTQLIGFSICGFAYRVLVSPPSMIWPSFPLA